MLSGLAIVMGLGGDKNVEHGMNVIIAIGVAAFILILIVALDYGGFATSYNTISQNNGQFSAVSNTVSNTVNAINIVGANQLTIALSGTTSWISASEPLTVQVTGNGITSYATNTVYAVPNNAQTLTFTVTSASATTLGGATTGNFYNITKVVLSGAPGIATPNVIASVGENYAGVAHGVAPWSSNTANSLSNANAVLAITQGTTFGVLGNFSSNGGALPNTYSNNAVLAVFALVFVAIVVAVIVVIRGRKAAEGGILQ